MHALIPFTFGFCCLLLGAEDGGLKADLEPELDRLRAENAQLSTKLRASDERFMVISITLEKTRERNSELFKLLCMNRLIIAKQTDLLSGKSDHETLIAELLGHIQKIRETSPLDNPGSQDYQQQFAELNTRIVALGMEAIAPF